MRIAILVLLAGGAISQLAAQSPARADSLRRRCELRIEANEVESGLADCGVAILNTPKDPAGYLFRGVQLWKLRRLQEALADFEKALSLDARNCEAMAYKGATDLNLGNPNLAEEVLEAAVKCDPKNTTALHSRALVRIYFSNFHGAIRDLSTAIELSPNDPAHYDRRASAFDSLGNQERADADRVRAREIRGKRR